MLHVSNIRIGTKLAIMSGLGGLMVLALMASQIVSGGWAFDANTATARRNYQVLTASQINTAFLGMRIGLTYVRLSDDAQDIKSGVELFQSRYADFTRLVEPLIATFVSAGPREKANTLKAGGDGYASAAAGLIAAKNEILALRSKAAAGALPAGDAARIATLKIEIERTASEKLVPTATQVMKLADDLAGSTSGKVSQAEAR